MPTVAHVLVIEDDPAIRSSLVRSLTDRGHAVSSARSGLDGLQQALDENPDLVLLDLGLPDLDGHSLLSMLRAVRQTPVIVVTARDDDPSVVKALDAGADDYVVKPFGMEQLEARMRAVLRRTVDDGTSLSLEVGDLAIDPASREATLRGELLDLSRGSSTCSPTWPSTSARSSASATSSRTCGTSRTAAASAPSTCTCRGCGASSARARLIRCTSTASAGSGIRLTAPTEGTDGTEPAHPAPDPGADI